ncbi:hypothetical protein [Aeromonas hydrophila]|uniref:hypothetical protein n=1 Tax=Aeromonas hydrophila TaxID=644 RepID=UPI0038CFCF2C
MTEVTDRLLMWSFSEEGGQLTLGSDFTDGQFVEQTLDAITAHFIELLMAAADQLASFAELLSFLASSNVLSL